MLINLKTNLYRRIYSLSVLNNSKNQFNKFMFSESIKKLHNLNLDEVEMNDKTENDDSFWKNIEDLKKIRICNEMSQTEKTKLQTDWMTLYRTWAKKTKCEIVYNTTRMKNKKYLCEIKLERKIKNYKTSYSISGLPSDTTKLANKSGFDTLFEFLNKKNLLELIDSKEKSVINISKFLKSLKLISLEKDIEKFKQLIEETKHNEFQIDQINQTYDVILTSLDLPFAEAAASIVYENLNLKQSEFISKHDCDYFKLSRFLLFFEIIEGLILNMRGLERKNNVNLQIIKSSGSDLYTCQSLEISKIENFNEDDLYSNNNNRNSILEKLIPDSFSRDDKESSRAIVRGDYVLIQIENDPKFHLGEVAAIETNFEVKLKCSTEFKEGLKFKIIKLATSVPTDVFIRNLKNFTNQKNSCCDQIRSIITRSTEMNEKLKGIVEEKIKNLDENFKLTNENLTLAQEEAIKQALTRRLTLIQGPPGTGKTKTAAEIVREWIKQDSSTPILVTADSNIAVDNIFKELGKLKIKALRIGNGNNIKDYFNTYNMSKAFTMLKKFPNEVKVVCATCVGSSAQSLEKFKFERVLIDEAAQSTEVSNIAALVNNTKQLVIIGDHKQLPPTVQSKIAEKYGYSISLFERLVNLGIKPVFLNIQYRMHPLIAEFPSIQFYEGQLMTGIKSVDRPIIEGFDWPNQDVPVAFINLMSSRDQFQGSSYFNSIEVEKVVEIVEKFNNSKTLKLDQIGIVTPYDAQKQKLNEAMKRLKLGRNSYNKNELNVNTVDGFQGMEKDLIIFSAVRSNLNDKVGFLADQRRLNVMLTRARRGIIVIGNKNTLKSNPQWKDWIEWCEKYKVIIENNDTTSQRMRSNSVDIKDQKDYKDYEDENIDEEMIWDENNQ